MTPLEAGKLLIHAAAFDNRKPSKAASHAWAEALKDMPADPDAYAAVARYYSEPADDDSSGELEGTRWIQPHHVRLIRRRIRAKRIPDGAFTYPAHDPDENGNQFVQRRKAQVQAIADGRITAEPIRELKGGPHPSVADTVAAIGQIPEHLRAELAEAGIGQRRQVWPELAVPCPLHACRALATRPCRTPKGREMRQGTHPSRQDAWRASQEEQGRAS